ncbi:MAG: hypothetical protein ACTSYU_12165 [Promethearchaeota archaeon]
MPENLNMWYNNTSNIGNLLGPSFDTYVEFGPTDTEGMGTIGLRLDESVLDATNDPAVYKGFFKII